MLALVSKAALALSIRLRCAQHQKKTAWIATFGWKVHKSTRKSQEDVAGGIKLEMIAFRKADQDAIYWRRDKGDFSQSIFFWSAQLSLVAKSIDNEASHSVVREKREQE